MPFVPKFQKRTEAVKAEDVEACKNLFIKPEYLNDILDIWNDNIDYSPSDIESIFEKAFQLGLVLEIRCLRGIFRFTLKYPNEENAYIQREEYSLDETWIHGSSLVVPREFRALGHGKDFSLMFIELAMLLGKKGCEFTSELENGGYVWARMGYYLNNNSARNVEDNKFLSEMLIAKLIVLKPLLPLDVYNKAITFRKLCNKDDLYKLANIDFDLSKVISQDDFSADGFLRQSLSDVFKDRTQWPDDEIEDRANKLCEAMQETISFCQQNKKTLNIGRLLLARERWHAQSDFTDDNQMKLISDYAGGFRNFEFLPVPLKAINNLTCILS